MASFIKRVTGRRAAVNLAATPRPDAQAGPTPNLDNDVGDYGGPTSSGYADAKGKALTAVMTSTKLTRAVVKAMREHPQVSACLVVQALPFLRAESTIECDDPDIREHVERWWDKVRQELMRSAAKALPHGYSPNVLVWDVDPDTGGLYVRKVRDLDPPTCKPLRTKSGDYAGFVQNEGQDTETRLEGDVDILSTLWLVEGMESGNLYGRSVLTAAREPWQDQQALNLYHLRGLERFGEPVVVTRAPSGERIVNQAEINAAVAAGETPPAAIVASNLDTALEVGNGLRNHSVVALPSELRHTADGKALGHAWTIEYLEAANAGAEAVLEGIREKDKAIARALLVPSLLLDGGETVGSNALGQSHRDTFTENAEARLEDYAAQITRHLIDRYVTLNFGPAAPRARLKFAPLGNEQTARLWAAATALIAGGVMPLDAPAIAARLGLPLADPESDDVDAAASSPFTQVGLPALVAAGIISEEEARALIGLEGPAPVKGAPVEPPIDDEQLAARRPSATLAAADVSNLPEWKLPQSFDPPAWHREANTREGLATFRRLEDGLNAAEADTVRALEELLEASRGRVLRQVEGIMRKGGSVADIVTALGTVNVGGSGPFAAAWVELQRTVWGLGLESVREQLTTFADAIPTAIGRDGLALVKAYATASAERAIADIGSRVQLELLASYRSGVGRAGLAAAVSDLFEREATGEGRPMRLTTRMHASRALNESRADAIERGGVPLRGAQYSALLDRHTCELCEDLDELVIAIEDLDFVKYTPPVHHNCRCVWVYITTEEADFTPTWSTPSNTKVDRYGSLIIGA